MNELTRAAVRQGGIITRAQAMSFGMTERMIDYRTAKGDWDVEVAGVYRVFPALDELDLLRSAVAALKDCVVSHGSAVRLLRLPLEISRHAEVTVGDSSAHEMPNVNVHRTRVPYRTDVVVRSDLPVTSVARTLIDIVPEVEPETWMDVVDALVLQQRVRLDQLGRVAHRVCGRGKAGSAVVNHYLRSRVAAVGQSELERRGHKLLRAHGIVDGIREFPMPWDERRRFDLAFPAARLAVEWDSRQWHGSVSAMTSDRRRDRDAAAHGWLIVRFTWWDVTRSPREVVASLARLLTQRTVGSHPH